MTRRRIIQALFFHSPNIRTFFHKRFLKKKTPYLQPMVPDMLLSFQIKFSHTPHIETQRSLQDKSNQIMSSPKCGQQSCLHKTKQNNHFQAELGIFILNKNEQFSLQCKWLQTFHESLALLFANTFITHCYRTLASRTRFQKISTIIRTYPLTNNNKNGSKFPYRQTGNQTD